MNGEELSLHNPPIDHRKANFEHKLWGQIFEKSWKQKRSWCRIETQSNKLWTSGGGDDEFLFKNQHEYNESHRN